MIWAASWERLWIVATLVQNTTSSSLSFLLERICWMWHVFSPSVGPIYCSLEMHLVFNRLTFFQLDPPRQITGQWKVGHANWCINQTLNALAFLQNINSAFGFSIILYFPRFLFYLRVHLLCLHLCHTVNLQHGYSSSRMTHESSVQSIFFTACHILVFVSNQPFGAGYGSSWLT